MGREGGEEPARTGIYEAALGRRPHRDEGRGHAGRRPHREDLRTGSDLPPPRLAVPGGGHTGRKPREGRIRRPGASPRPAAAPRHEVTGERRGEEGDGMAMTAGDGAGGGRAGEGWGREGGGGGWKWGRQGRWARWREREGVGGLGLGGGYIREGVGQTHCGATLLLCREPVFGPQ
jgi:hypothetical protein